MAFDPGAIDATLAAAVADEPKLMAELRLALAEGVARALAALEAADTPERWRAAAWRMGSLAASFGAVRLMALANAAAEGAPFDKAVLRKLRRAAGRL